MARTRFDYGSQSATFDRTRHASPSILDPLLLGLSQAPGRKLLDVAGGTGNYGAALARHFDVFLLDVSEAMVRRAQKKQLPVLVADASQMPLRSESFDAAVIVSALHLMPRWRRVIREVRRVLRSGGRLAIHLYARENLAAHWVLDYFPSRAASARREHQGIGELLAELEGAKAFGYEFTDIDDASLAAMCRQPQLLLDPAWRAQTSFFGRFDPEDSRELRDGIERLERDLNMGLVPPGNVEEVRRRYGDGTIIWWTKP